ncbi:MAG: hypothetical protein K2X47_18320 [Bdellovibrionales bacterium]|nr:hypothetical protein [Bdellovibrionales bacterium]
MTHTVQKMQFERAGEVWTDRRKRIFDYISERHVGLAELYHGTVCSLFTADIPGRNIYVCQSIREITNRLPESASGKESKRSDPRVITPFAEAWKKEMQTLGTLLSEEAPLPLEAKQTIEISRSLAELAEAVVRNSGAGTDARIESAINLFSTGGLEVGTVDNPSPLILQWLNATGYFAKLSHIKKGGCDDTFDWRTAEKLFLEIEQSLFALSTEFFNAVGALDVILDNANG